MARPRTIRPPAIAGGLLLAVAGGLLSPPPASAEDPFADAVHALELGTNGGFGSELLPDIVLGPPRGTGLTQGSFDVLALGDGGEIVLRFEEPFICDGPGVDFTVFENAFHSGGSVAGAIFDELGYIAVSQDGVTFFELPFDRVALTGLAGQTPVESNPDNGIDPTDPTVSGGDSFDLADVGLAWASYVRITDVGGDIPDVGDLPPFLPPPNAGFDLDAVAAVHTCPPQSDDTPTPTASATPPPTTPSALPTPSSTSTATAAPPSATASATPSATPTSTNIPASATPPPSTVGDVDGDGAVTAADELLLIAEIFDGDGRQAEGAAGGSVASDASADVNGDSVISVGDLAAIAARRTR